LTPLRPEIELRTITEDDRPAWHACLGTAFGHHANAEFDDRWMTEAGLDKSLAAFDAGELVGTAAWFPIELTVPRALTVAAASVVAVTVLPTHRRRGTLRAMMNRQLTELRDAGFAVSLLTASEGGIYGRFGYGPATSSHYYELDKRVARLAEPVRAPGNVRVVSLDQAEEACPAVWETARLRRPGELSLSLLFWEAHFHQLDFRGIDERRRFFAVYEQGGTIEGVVDYQVVEDPASPRDRLVSVELLVASTAEAYEALVAYLLGIDLTTKLVMRHRPGDEPLRELLANGRQLRTTRSWDDLWLRPLDVRALLSARDYVPGPARTLRFAVHDRLLPANEGVYELEIDDSGRAEVSGPLPSPAGEDLELDVSGLGSVVLGGRRLPALLDAGRAVEHTPGAAWRADALFLAEREPFATVSF
jgi:predicted acetyltransferase